MRQSRYRAGPMRWEVRYSRPARPPARLASWAYWRRCWRGRASSAWRPTMLLGVGSLVGLLLGVFASRLLGQIVYQANPRDPVVVVGAVLTMALLGIAASAIPALRALAVDPSKLLREE